MGWRKDTSDGLSKRIPGMAKHGLDWLRATTNLRAGRTCGCAYGEVFKIVGKTPEVLTTKVTYMLRATIDERAKHFCRTQAMDPAIHMFEPAQLVVARSQSKPCFAIPGMRFDSPSEVSFPPTHDWPPIEFLAFIQIVFGIATQKTWASQGAAPGTSPVVSFTSSVVLGTEAVVCGSSDEFVLKTSLHFVDVSHPSQKK